MPAPLVALITILLTLLVPASAAEARPGLLGRAKALLSKRVVRNKARLARRATKTHRRLVKQGARIELPRSSILSDEATAAKRYGDSWTCRESTRLLIKSMPAGSGLRLASSGHGAFRWGDEGLVSYHYYAVDRPRKPTMLVDPTAASNFAVDARPGGALSGLLHQAELTLKQPGAARRIAGKILRAGRNNRPLVLFQTGDIAVYREALERAARLSAGVQRNRERNGP